MLISMMSIPLWAAIAVLVSLWGLLVWRMIVMLPEQYLWQTIIGLTGCSVLFIIRDRASHFGLESAALQESALHSATLVSTLGQPHIYRRMLALSEVENTDRDTRRAAYRAYWGYAARLAACVAVLFTALAVGVKGALLPGRVPLRRHARLFRVECANGSFYQGHLRDRPAGAAMRGTRCVSLRPSPATESHGQVTSWPRALAARDRQKPMAAVPRVPCLAGRAGRARPSPPRR